MNNKNILYEAILKTGCSKEDAEIISTCYSTKDKYMSIIFSHKFAEAFFGEEILEKISISSIWGDWMGYISIEECKKKLGKNYNKIFNEYDVYEYNNHHYIPVYTDGWKTRLSEMVLEEEPLKYLEKFLRKS